MAAIQQGAPVVRAVWFIVQDAANGTQAQVFRLTIPGSLAGHALAGAELRQVTNAGTSAFALVRTVSTQKFTLCTLEPGERYDVPAGLGAQLLLGMWTAEFPAARKGWPAGNQLVIVRSYLDNGKDLKVSTERMTDSGDFVANSNGARFMNRGLNSVSIGEVLLGPGQEFEIRPEPNYLLSTPLRVSFDDGTTSRGLSLVNLGPLVLT